jgi:hypothetical protein
MEPSATASLPIEEPSSASDVSQDLRDGDIIFQESNSRQSEMVGAVTRSRWTHMGVILNVPDGAVVLEAVSPVGITPLRLWIERGRGHRYVVKRLRDVDVRLSPAAVKAMQDLGATWIGRPYDVLFRWDDQSLYCSELVYKLFDRAAGIQVGRLERAGDMNLDDERVQAEIRRRFVNVAFDPTETVVTPDSVFQDDQLILVSAVGEP